MGEAWCPDNDGQYPYPADEDECYISLRHTLAGIEERAEGRTGPYGTLAQVEAERFDLLTESVEHFDNERRLIPMTEIPQSVARFIPTREEAVIRRLQRRLSRVKARAALIAKCEQFSPAEREQALLYWLKRKRWVSQRDRAAAKAEKRRLRQEAERALPAPSTGMDAP